MAIRPIILLATQTAYQKHVKSINGEQSTQRLVVYRLTTVKVPTAMGGLSLCWPLGSLGSGERDLGYMI